MSSSNNAVRNLSKKKSREEDENDPEFNLKISKYSRGSLDNVKSKSLRFKGLKKKVELQLKTLQQKRLLLRCYYQLIQDALNYLGMET